MTHITLVRHGQANTQARDEAAYDRLSELGHRQAEWLGAHLRDGALPHTRVYCGTLRRHRETAAAMGVDADIVADARLNELEYFTLAQALHAQKGVLLPQSREDFVSHLPQVFSAWEADEITDPPETWGAFANRIGAVLDEIAEGDGPALVVTSGGLIAMAMRRALGLDTPATARLALAIMNTSVHRLFRIGGDWTPVLFNAVPHLDHPDRSFAQTHM